jgi:hypothetical protein
MKPWLYSISLGLVITLLSACGGGGGGGSSTGGGGSNTITGVFVDDPVAGLSYSCSSGASGVTNNQGEYTCNVGDMVTFSIGDLVIGTVEATSVVTPYTLIPNDRDAAINLARLLQSLDQDNLTGRITLDTALTPLIPADLDFTSATFVETAQSALGIELVSETQAESQLNSSLASYGFTIPAFGEVTHNGRSYQMVISPYTGRVWLDRNLGSLSRCESVNDGCQGGYYQWGRMTDGHENLASALDNRINSDYAIDFTNTGSDQFIVPLISGLEFSTDWTSVDLDGTGRQAFWAGEGGICPTGFRVPSLAELEAEFPNSFQSDADQINHFLSLASQGRRTGIDGQLDDTHTFFLWSSDARYNNDLFDPNQFYSWAMWLDLGTDAVKRTSQLRRDGANVRCVKALAQPVADAGASRTIVNGATVTLDGSASASPDGFITSYEWFKNDTDTPISSEAKANIGQPTSGKHTYTLRVTDNLGQSATDRVIVRVIDNAPGTVLLNGIGYREITSPFTGKRWLDRNLGATQVCTSQQDSACYGDYYQWGRKTDGHEKSDSTTTTSLHGDLNVPSDQFTLQTNSDFFDWVISELGGFSVDADGFERFLFWSQSDGSSVCPTGYRVPTIVEILQETTDSLDNNSNSEALYQNFLKIPAAGYRSALDGSMFFVGERSSLWSSTPSGRYALSLDADSAILTDTFAPARSKGKSLRCTEATTAPTAHIDGDVRVLPGRAVNLTAAGSTGSYTVVSYEWWLAGVMISTSETLTLTDLEEGDHSITLVVTDSQGIEDTLTQTVRITPETTFSHNGVEYSSVKSPATGRIWLDRNLGASQVCTAADDENCYGDYYQWGREADGHQLSDSLPSETLEGGILLTGDRFVISTDGSAEDWTVEDTDGLRRLANWNRVDGGSVCPAGFRVPTLAELEEDTIYKNASGNNDLFASFLKLPAAGRRRSDNGIVELSGGASRYGTTYLTSNMHVCQLASNNDSSFQLCTNPKLEGASLRCVQDNQTNFNGPMAIAGLNRTVADGTSITLSANGSKAGDFPLVSYEWSLNGTVLSDQISFTKSDYAVGTNVVKLKVTDNNGVSGYDSVMIQVTGGITHNGVTYNTVTSPYTGMVWLDRNIGATQTCTSLDDSNCFGYYYQWGRGHDGHEQLNPSTQATAYPNLASVTSNLVVNTSGNLSDWVDGDSDGTARQDIWNVNDGSSICPPGFTVPSFNQWSAETLAQGLDTSTELLNSFLKLAESGNRNSEGNLSTGTQGWLWTLGTDAGSNDSSYALRYNDFSSATSYILPRIYSMPVRCIQYTPN